MVQPYGSVIELCHVVRDIDSAMAHWMNAMGAGPFFMGDIHIDKHRYRGRQAPFANKVAFGFSGGLLIELIQPLGGDESVFTEALQATGEGYHHVMLNLDFDEGFERFSRLGFEVALDSVTPFDERAVLFDTRGVNGGFVEIMDLSKSFKTVIARLEDAHGAWDRKSLKVHPLTDLFR